MKTKNYAGEGAVLLAAILWGCIGFFTRNLISAGFTPVQIVAVRALFTSLFMGIIITVKNPKLFVIKIKDIWVFIGTGICSFMFFNICYMYSIKENSLSVACILMYTSPVWVTVISAFVFREKITVKKVSSLIICLVGCACVCLSSSLKYTKAGLVFGLLSGLGYALYSIFGKAASKYYDSLTTVFYTFLFSLVALLPFCKVQQIAVLAAKPVNLVLLLGISVVNTLLPYILYTFGLYRIEAGKAAVISIIEPVSSAITGLVFFSEHIGISGIIGMALVVSGLYLLTINKKA